MIRRGIEALADVLIFSCMLASAQEASILVPPTSLTVGVDSVANFCCNATGTLFNWFIDGKHENNEMNRRRGISAVETENLNGYVVGILTIPATTRNNNTVIYCSVAGTNGIRSSPNATLTVQGLLSPPPSLRIHYFSDPYHHSLLWNAPFTLDLTNTEPDITLFTICNNLTRHCVTTEEKEYTFTNLCTPIMFSITAQNIVGEGNASSITYEPRNHERPTKISSIEEEVMFSSSSEPNITLQFQVDGNCYDLVEVQIVGNFSNQTTTLGPVIPNVTDAGGVEVILADNITTNEVYNITVSDENADQSPEVTEETTLTTFDVQGESITCDQGVIKVTCIFARGSMAQGCLIVIVPVGNRSSIKHSEKALRQESNGVLSRNTSHSFNLSVDTYNIMIFDVEADGSVDQIRWLYNERITVNATCVSPSTTASLPAPSPLEPGPTLQMSPPMGTDQVSMVTIAVLTLILLLCTTLILVVILVLVMIRNKRKSETCDNVQENLYSENPNRSDHSLERMVSLPQGAANTDLDDESGIGEGSEPEDIDDTPTSVRMDTTTPMYAELNLIEHAPAIHEWKGMTAAVTPSTGIEGEEVNLQSLVKHLLNIAPKWQLLGEQL